MDLNNLNKINTQVSALENNESDNKITEQEKAIAEALKKPENAERLRALEKARTEQERKPFQDQADPRKYQYYQR